MRPGLLPNQFQKDAAVQSVNALSHAGLIKIQLRDQGGFKCVPKKARTISSMVINAGFFRSPCVKALLAQVLPVAP
jgi:hypothetical protein